MNIFILALLIFAIAMSVMAVIRILVVYFGNKKFTSTWGLHINVFFIVLFGTLAFWLPQFL